MLHSQLVKLGQLQGRKEVRANQSNWIISEAPENYNREPIRGSQTRWMIVSLRRDVQVSDFLRKNQVIVAVHGEKHSGVLLSMVVRKGLIVLYH